MSQENPTLEDAIALAALKHKRQIDKAGAPYILHPLRVMALLGRDATEAERIVAVLHDVPEDCEVSFDDLAQMGYSSEVIEALKLVTKVKGEPYEDFIARLAPNAVARRVKLCDLEDNSDRTRLAQVTQRDTERLAKYERATAFLKAASST